MKKQLQSEKFPTRAINHAWFVYNFQGTGSWFCCCCALCKCLCWENISIVVINNKIVFFVTRFWFDIQATYITELIPNNNIDLIRQFMLSTKASPLAFNENLFCSLRLDFIRPFNTMNRRFIQTSWTELSTAPGEEAKENPNKIRCTI